MAIDGNLIVGGIIITFHSHQHPKTLNIMKPNRLLFLLSVLMITWNQGLLSQLQPGLNDLLVTTNWLEENLTDSLVVVLHYGMKSDYEKEHIPGARLISIWELLVEDELGRRHEFPDKQKIEKVLRSWGLNNNSKIIISYQDGNAIPWASRPSGKSFTRASICWRRGWRSCAPPRAPAWCLRWRS